MKVPWRPKWQGTVADTSDLPGWERFKMWVLYDARLTKGWTSRIELWWGYNVRHFPKPPPLALDRVAEHLGFYGHSPCTDGPVCARHGFSVAEK